MRGSYLVMFRRLRCKHNNLTYLKSGIEKYRYGDTAFYKTTDTYKCNFCKKIIDVPGLDSIGDNSHVFKNKN